MSSFQQRGQRALGLHVDLTVLSGRCDCEREGETCSGRLWNDHVLGSERKIYVAQMANERNVLQNVVFGSIGWTMQLNSVHGKMRVGGC